MNEMNEWMNEWDERNNTFFLFFQLTKGEELLDLVALYPEKKGQIKDEMKFGYSKCFLTKSIASYINDKLGVNTDVISFSFSETRGLIPAGAGWRSVGKRSFVWYRLYCIVTNKQKKKKI